MKRPFASLLRRLLWLAMPALLVLTGCGTLSHTDCRILSDHGVSPPTRAKMAHCGKLTPEEIVEVSRAGLLPEYIAAYIRASHARYELSDADAFRLNQQGVNPTVIAYMFATPSLMDRFSDRLTAIDWAPYYFPLFAGRLNTFGEESYISDRPRIKSSGTHTDSTLQKQQQDMSKILGKTPSS
jgi:hypothetical protein